MNRKSPPTSSFPHSVHSDSRRMSNTTRSFASDDCGLAKSAFMSRVAQSCAAPITCVKGTHKQLPTVESAFQSPMARQNPGSRDCDRFLSGIALDDAPTPIGPQAAISPQLSVLPAASLPAIPGSEPGRRLARQPSVPTFTISARPPWGGCPGLETQVESACSGPPYRSSSSCLGILSSDIEAADWELGSRRLGLAPRSKRSLTG
jgi:hypothetical protein